jgi:hypothetical protein
MDADQVLMRVTGRCLRSFVFGRDLGIHDDGTCVRVSACYAGGCDDGNFTGYRADPFARFEVWAF